MNPSADKDALAPAASTTYLLLALLGFGLLIGIPAAISGTGSIMGFGNAYVCVEEPTGGTLGQGSPMHSPRAGVDVGRIGYSYCTDSPDLAQRVWYTLTMLPMTLLSIGVLMLMISLVRRATRHGVYTGTTARLLRLLAWILVVGGILVPLGEQAAQARLLAAMGTDPIEGYFMPGGQLVNLPLILIGIGVLTFARVVQLGSRMRSDLDGTI